MEDFMAFPGLLGAAVAAGELPLSLHPGDSPLHPQRQNGGSAEKLVAKMCILWVQLGGPKMGISQKRVPKEPIGKRRKIDPATCGPWGSHSQIPCWFRNNLKQKGFLELSQTDESL